MIHLTPAAAWMLEAVFAVGALTFVMGGWMSVVRIRAMAVSAIPLQDFAHTREVAPRLPSSVRRVADNYNHLFEAPTVFYACSVAIIVAGLADPVYAACAWAFFGLRALHSMVQATFNRVAVRAWLYGLSWIPLCVLIIRPLFQL
jgi:hypothetical protein